MRRFVLGMILFASGALITAGVCRAAAAALLCLDDNLAATSPWQLALANVHGGVPLLIGILLAVVGFGLMLWQILLGDR